MNEELSHRVRSAAVAGWWTVLIGAAWMTVAWCIMLPIMWVRPQWMLTLWGGGDVGWDTYQIVVICFFGVFKLMLFACVLISLWLTLWQRRLRREEQ